jgi:chromatin remodeling complex protein RSC6
MEAPQTENLNTIETSAVETLTPEETATQSAVLNKIDNLLKLDKVTKSVLNKNLRSIRSDVVKLEKLKQKKRRGNTNSGFQKPGKLTNEMYEFTGFEKGSLHSRTELTIFLCKYIEEHKLQNPENRRIILVESDEKLMKALKFDPSKYDKLTYPIMQKLIQIKSK